MDNIVVMNSQIMRHIARLNDLCEYIYNIFLSISWFFNTV